jgi:hypothetical protein
MRLLSYSSDKPDFWNTLQDKPDYWSTLQDQHGYEQTNSKGPARLLKYRRTLKPVKTTEILQKTSKTTMILLRISKPTRKHRTNKTI